MSLSAGDRIGPFEVVSLVGEGGMGQVYRARDAKLARDVAIKVLPDAFARDPERLTRFRREAQALAALNDSHIAQIYHLDESAGRAALVMEFVEGRTLADLIHGRPLDVEDALRYAGEIAAGLETAHEKGIVHRDLKPANVKITPDGHAKILDFGLAKAMAGDVGSGEVMNSPTLTARATEAGVILGTAAYMSPEQARGKAIDKRTDIWAFGAVLFEMLTGRRAFEGETVSDTLASVLRSDPDWPAMPPGVPAHVRALLGRCLERDSSRRLRDIGEARVALAGAASSAPPSSHTTASMISGPMVAVNAARPWPWIAATAVLLVAIAALLPTSSLMRREATAASADSFELAIGAPAGAEFQIGSNSGNVILSPDGTRIAFVAATDKARTIWIRSLAVDDARSIPGTENASNLFWSPDGRSIGFFAGVKLRTVSIAGGLPETIADATGGRGGSWSDDGTIIFAPIGGSALFRVAASGGTVAPLTTLDASRGENAHYWPEFLPGGRQFLYFARSTQLDNNGIYLGNMDGSPAVRLIPSLSSGILARHPVSAGWYLMWARDDDLLGQPFDVTTGRLAGDVSTIARGVRVEESQRLLYASASRNGRLVWATSRAAETALSLFGRDGRRISVLDVPPGKLVQPALSPDGSRLLFTRVEQGTADIYLYDFRKKVTERLTTDPDYDESPVWTSDGLAMMYMGRDRSERVVFRLAIGSGGRPVKVQSEGAYSPGIETPDRRYAIVSAPNPKTGRDVAALSPASAGTLVPLLQDPGDQQPLALSVDGRALFVGLVSGSRNAVGVGRLYLDRPTPTLGPIQMVAEDAQAIAVRPDGREAFVLAPDGFIKAIALTPGNDNVAIGATTSLFPAPPGTGGFSVNPTGTQFVVAEAPFVMGQTIRVLTRWDARLGK